MSRALPENAHVRLDDDTQRKLDRCLARIPRITLARRMGISVHTIISVEDGGRVRPPTAEKIRLALAGLP